MGLFGSIRRARLRPTTMVLPAKKAKRLAGSANELPGGVRPRLSGAAELAGQVAQVQPRHLVLERAQRYPEIPRGAGHVPVGFLERPQDEVALEGVARLLEARLAGRRAGV